MLRHQQDSGAGLPSSLTLLPLLLLLPMVRFLPPLLLLLQLLLLPLPLLVLSSLGPELGRCLFLQPTLLAIEFAIKLYRARSTDAAEWHDRV